MLRNLIFTCIFAIAAFSSTQAQISIVFTGGTAEPGESIDIDVSVSDFTDIVSFQFSVNWDPNVLTFGSIENVTTDLEQFSAEGNIGTPPGAIAVSEGQLTASWNLDNTDPRSLSDDTRLFSIRFNSVGAACDQTNISLSDTPRRIEVADDNFVDISAIATNSVVELNGVNCEDNGGGDNGGGDNGGDDNGGGTTTFPECDNSYEGTTDVVLAVDCVGADVGATNICVPVTTANFSNIASLQTGVTWDPTQLSFTSINEVGITGITTNENDASNGSIRLLWIIGFSDDPVSVDDDAVLFEVCFDVLGDNGVSAQIMLSDLPSFNVEVASGDGVTLDVSTGVGSINVGQAGGDNGGGDNGGDDNGGGDNGGDDNGGGDNGGGSSSGGTENMCADSDDTSIIIQGGTVPENGNICIPVTSMNFNNIASLQTGFQWDSNVIDYTGINEVTLTGVTLNESNVDNGDMRILWLVPFGGDNISPADGSVLFEICFDGIGTDEQTSALEFVELTNFGIEVANGSGDTETLCISQGQLTIGEDNGGGDNGGNNDGGTNMGTNDGTNLCASSSDVSLILSDFAPELNQNICVPVTTRNFTDIASIQTGITWNSNVLSFTAFEEEAISGVSLNESNTADGELKLLWLIGLGDDPVTLDDDVILFNVCFDVVGVSGESSSVDIESLPGFAIEVASGAGLPQTVCIDNGFVQLEGEIMTGGDLVLNGETITNAQTGQQSCVDISVQNFENVQSAQFNIQWDSTFMTYADVMNPGVLNNFGNGNINQTAGNNLRISWNPNSSQSVADNSTIFTLCFDVIGSCEGTRMSPLTFVNTPTIGIEFTNNSNELIPVNVQSGTVGITCDTGPETVLGPGIITGPMCPDDATGSIMIAAPGAFIAPVSCTWTREDGSVVRSSTDNCNLIGVPSGTYTLTATDATGQTDTRMYLIPSVEGEPEITFNTVDATCTTGGSINTDIRGATGPFSFAWTGGLPDTEDQTGLDAATYQVTITDTNTGCTFIRTVPVRGAINSEDPLSIVAINIQNGTCDGGSRIEIDPMGGCRPYSYMWTGPNGETSTESDLFRIAAGTWNVTVTDFAGGTISETYMITSDVPEIQITESSVIRPTCDALNSGSIFVDVTGGCSTYIYEWNGPNGFRSTQEDISNLEAGEYTLDVTDSSDAGIFTTRRITLTLEGNVDFTSEVINVSNLEGNNGAINIDIPGGGLDTLGFAWSDGSTDLSRDSLMAGEYTLTISDGTDCPTIFFTEVKWTAIFLDGVDVSSPVSCIDLEDAVISGNIIGGCEERIIRVNGVETSFPLMNLAPGTYEITADDACGTMASKTITIEPYQSFTVNPAIVCDSNEADSGRVTLETTGGSENFSVEWSDGTVDPNDQRIVSGLSQGAITAIISDGCEDMEVSNINVPDCTGPDDDPTVCIGTPIITPNGDNLNETLNFSCDGSPAPSPNNLTIYDRWGRLVFEANNYNNTWSGTDSDGQALSEGGYLWVLVEGTGINRVIHRGTVTVLKSGN